MIRTARALPLPLALSLVAVLPLSAQLGPIGTQFWRLGQAGIDGPLQSNARTGQALAAGDFNCDGFEDLAIGVPGFDVLDTFTDAGALLVLYGSATGLGTAGSQFFDQTEAGFETVPEEHDGFASALAAGDFNGNGCDDLAVGIPFEDMGADEEAINDGGFVAILRGTEDGLVPAHLFYQGWDQAGVIAGIFEAGDRFGQALVAHDFDQDGFDDLAVGVPGEDLSGVPNAGAVNVVFGSPNNLNGARDIVLFRGSGDLPGSPETGEQLGLALAAGELTVFAGRELAIGCPFRDPAGGPANAGEVLLVSDVADASPSVQTLHAGLASVPGDAEADARFGAALAAGDFDGDGFGEIAIGVPGYGDGAPEALDHGAVAVVERDTGNGTLITQSLLGPDNEEAFDQFGSVLAAADFDADGYADLAIGVPLENLSTLNNTGMIHVVHGGLGGFDLEEAQTWLQTLDPSEDEDAFGFALAAGRFAGHSASDLAIAAPFEQIGGAAAAGGVNVLYTLTLFNDGFESGDTSAWDLVVP